MRVVVWITLIVGALAGCATSHPVNPGDTRTPPGHVDTWGWVADVSPGSMGAYFVTVGTDDHHHYEILINPQLWRSVVLHDRTPTDLLGQRVHLAAAITDETAVHELGWGETLTVLAGAADRMPVAIVDEHFDPAAAGTVRRWQGRVYVVEQLAGSRPVMIQIAPPGLGPRVLVYLERQVVEALAAEGHPVTALGHDPIEVRGLMQVEFPTTPSPNYFVLVRHREQLVLATDPRP